MDYHARHGHDVCSFDLPSTHRLPTVSAAQALQDLNDVGATPVLLGLPDLDRALTGSTSSTPLEPNEKGGLSKGQITEIWGPPGVGKTAVAIQAAVNVLRDGRSVVWVDCFHPVCHKRFTDLCKATLPEGDENTANPLEKLVHFSCPGLAHVIALLCRPTKLSLPRDTTLIVVDSLSALINHAFPRIPAQRGGSKSGNKGPSPASRRIQILQYIVGALQKLAATRDAAVVLLSQCATRMQVERGATLIPAVNANVWEQGIATRVALYRDWVWSDGSTLGARHAAVQKVNGQLSPGLDKVFAYKIQSTGLVAVDYDGVKPAGAISYTPMQKRKLDETGFEVPDSEDEYGWGEEDTSALPGQPPQWQGSEDIILGAHPETEEDEDEDEDEASELASSPEEERDPSEQ